jgi:hypothetical protein
MASAAAAPLSPSALSPLPLPLVLHVFSLLPADASARAACVCRGWRVTLDEVSLWTRLDVSPSSGVAVRVTDAVLAGAAAKARGRLAALDVSGCEAVTFTALLAVVQANGGSLRGLCVGTRMRTEQNLDVDHVQSLLQAAPQVTVCRADVVGDSGVADARRMLRNEAPFQPLRLHALGVNFDYNDADEEEAEATTLALALAADIAAHASLKLLQLHNADIHTRVALDAVVDAALTREMNSLELWSCHLSPASAPALARLLGGGTLTELLFAQTEQLLDAPSAALLGDALRANSTLTSLAFHWGFWHNADGAAALLGALTGHGNLRRLALTNNHVLAAGAVAGPALGALVAAKAVALTELDVSYSDLGDAGLRPLLEALPHNTHLRTLLIAHNDVSDALAADVLLPAVHANTSLRVLRAGAWGGAHAALRESQALVAARAAAA